MKLTDEGRFLVCKPDDPYDRTTPGKTDPVRDSRAIVDRDWSKEGVQLVIVDTFTVMCYWLLQAVAASKVAPGDRITLADGHVTPNMQDYNPAYGIVISRLQEFFAMPQHVILLAHVGAKTEPIVSASGARVGGRTVAQGFGTIGKKLVDSIASWFDPGVVTIRTTPMPGNKTNRVVHFSDVDNTICKWRSLPTPAPMPVNDFDGCSKFFTDVVKPAADVGPLRMGIFSLPGAGKTTLATTAWPDVDRILYVAYDKGSEALRTTWPQAKKESP